MTKFALLILTAVAISIGSGLAVGQGQHGGGHAGGGGHGGQGGAGGGWHGGQGGAGGGWHGGQGGAGGAWRGGHGGAGAAWRGGNWAGNNWSHGNWHGGRSHGGYYGHRGYWYSGRGYPYYSFGFGFYPYYSYPYPAYPAYPLYADAAPPVYVERYPPPEYAEPPPPAEPPRPQRAPAPIPTPERLERYTLSATELFEFDRAVLRLPQPKLDDIADAMVRNPQINNVRIIGYTDRIGTDSYNVRLSQRRAEAVRTYIVSKGVAPTRLIAVGKGKADPVVQCSDKMSRPQLIKCLEPNRRVVIEQITVERRVRASQM